MPIKTDKRGYVTPYRAVLSTQEELKTTFVDRFPDSITRANLYDGYLVCCQMLLKIVGAHTQWVDGSFTTGKTNPNDVDVLIFVSHALPLDALDNLQKLMRTSKSTYGVDLYAVQTYPTDHPRNAIYEIDKVEWLNQFTKTRKMGHRRIQYDKGFLELNIS